MYHCQLKKVFVWYFCYSFLFAADCSRFYRPIRMQEVKWKFTFWELTCQPSQLLQKKLAPLFYPIRVKPKPIVTHSHTFSRASRQLHVSTLCSDWFTGLSVCFVIGWSDHFGVNCTILDRKLLKTEKQKSTILKKKITYSDTFSKA